MKKFRDTDYFISEEGRIYKNSKEISRSKMTRGYLSCSLYKDGKQKTHYVHRLVAELYIPNPNNKPYVNHINGDKEDNRVKNLEWCTPEENSQHSVSVLRKEMGEKHSRARVPDRIVSYVKKCKTHNVVPNFEKIASTYGVKPEHIKRIYQGHKRKVF
jgi:hypothetical protein